MSLGLDELTDDQLMELLNEACIELAVRDPIVRKLAQGCIRDTAALLPEIRKRIKETIEEINEEELEESDSPRRGGFSVPQNPVATPPSQSPSPFKTVSIIAPVGYRDLEITISERLRRQVGRPVGLRHTNSPHIFQAVLDDAEIQLIKQSPLFAQFNIVVIP